jgi:uncharacterized membrane protein YeaQ/YmgE (transglycosylase-associated protein family)
LATIGTPVALTTGEKLQEFIMSLFAWILLGLVAGFIGSHMVNHRGEGMVLDVLLGIVGAIVGGWLAHLFGFAGITRLNVHSLVVATAGAIVFLLLYHTIRRNVFRRRFF